jgi:hypothetical protein
VCSRRCRPDSRACATSIRPSTPAGAGAQADARHGDEEGGERGGFGGKRYLVGRRASAAFDDRFDDYCAFLIPASSSRSAA